MNRRGFLRGAGALLVTAPAIVRASSLMAVKPWKAPTYMIEGNWVGYSGTFSVASELTAMTRAAFVPRVVVQIYQATPLMLSLTE